MTKNKTAAQKRTLERKRKARRLRFLPIGLDVKGKRVIFIGGGSVALQKLKTVTRFGPRVSVYAREILPEIKALGVKCREGEYQPELLAKAFIVYACSSDRTLNRRVKADATRLGILCNVADDTDVCDFISPAVILDEELVVAVNSQGRAPTKAREARDFIQERLHEFLHGRR